MHILFRIIYAGHASGTHHKLALDALRHLRCAQAEQWQRLFLDHAKPYLEGSKAPDNRFKDFKNHVLHPRDGFWGGAPDKVRSWYGQLVDALGQEQWPTAAYAAGVLGHYYTDPLQPFHTGQSEAENNIHRAVEWSISKSYDALARQGEQEFAALAVEVPAGPNWLAELVCRGAQLANGSYEKLIAHYDFQRGVVDPPAGLDPVARRLVAQLIRHATLGLAAVLDRAIGDSGASPPHVPLAAATVAAMAQVPFRLIAGRIADAEERRTVERMYDELIATGTVEVNLPEDDRMVRDLHALEVLSVRPPLPEVSKLFPIEPSRASGGPGAPPASQAQTMPRSDNVVPLRAPPPADAPSAPEPAEVPAAEPAALRPRSGTGLMAKLERVTMAEAPPGDPEPAATPPAQASAPRLHLTLDADVVDGPAIVPKTAERLRAHGIATVRDLLAADPAELAKRLDARHITAASVTDWQDGARLVCSVPDLRGTHAQLLLGAGYRSAEAIAAADADKLCADVLAFAASADGQRLLRNGDPPDLERIKGWLEAAQSVKAA